MQGHRWQSPPGRRSRPPTQALLLLWRQLGTGLGLGDHGLDRFGIGGDATNAKERHLLQPLPHGQDDRLATGTELACGIGNGRLREVGAVVGDQDGAVVVMDWGHLSTAATSVPGIGQPCSGSAILEGC